MTDTTTIDTSTAAVTALLDGVTPGPWQYDLESGQVAVRENLLITVAELDGEQDGNFIAAARELMPALVSERDELRGNIGAAVTRAEHAEARGKVLVEALKDAAADLDDYSPLTGNTVQTVASMRVRAAISAWEKANDLGPK